MTDPARRGGHLHPLPTGEDADPYLLWDAAYVLGSLSSNERREYEAHLTTCPSCRTSVGELGGMPALLAMLGPDEVAAIDDCGLEPPPIRPQLLDTVLGRVRRHRRRARWITWTVAAAAAVVLGIGVLIAVRPGQLTPAPTAAPPVASALSMTQVVPSSLQATVSVTSRGWGTVVDMTCTYHEEAAGADDGEAGDRLAMYAVGHDGSRVELATWMAVEGATASPSGSTSMPIDEIAAVQVVSADTGELLLQRSL